MRLAVRVGARQPTPGAPLQWSALGLNGHTQVGNCAIDDRGSAAWRIDVDEPSTPAVLDAQGRRYFAAGL